jgi:hypothetical protein
VLFCFGTIFRPNLHKPLVGGFLHFDTLEIELPQGRPPWFFGMCGKHTGYANVTSVSPDFFSETDPILGATRPSCR